MNPTIPAEIGSFLTSGEPCVIAITEDPAVAGVECPTCGGEGKLYCDGCGGHLCSNPLCEDPTCPDPHWCPDDCDGTTPDCDNPLCRDGDLLHGLRVECDQGLIVADGWDHSWCGRSSTEPLPCDDGYRTVFARIEVVPVRDARTCDAAVQPKYPDHFCVFTSGRVARIWAHDQYLDLTPAHVAALEAHHGPAAGWVDQFVIVATVVER